MDYQVVSFECQSSADEAVLLMPLFPVLPSPGQLVNVPYLTDIEIMNFLTIISRLLCLLLLSVARSLNLQHLPVAAMLNSLMITGITEFLLTGLQVPVNMIQKFS